MPAKPIRAKYSKSSKSRKSHSANRIHRGGDPGRVALPPTYFGNGTRGYFADGSRELNSCSKQHAVSQGVLSADGKWAGPNLYPMMGGRRSQKGGSCGCGRKNKSKKSKKSKSHINKH